MTFNSNVSPKRVVKAAPREAWYCWTCDTENAAYYSKCRSCNEHRPH